MILLKYLTVIHVVLFLVSLTKLLKYNINNLLKLNLLLNMAFPIYGMTVCLNLLISNIEDVNKKIKILTRDFESKQKEEYRNKNKEVTDKIFEFLGGYIRSSYHGEDRFNCKTDISSKFRQILSLTEKINDIYKNKKKVESVNNYVFELFDRLIGIDPEMKHETFKTVEEEVSDMLGEYHGLLKEIVKEAESINEQIATVNKKKIKQFYGASIKEMKSVLEKMKEDFIEE